MMWVHKNDVERWESKGYIVLGESPRGGIEIADPEKTCLREMRTGRCRMDKDHRGRCSTVVFYCEACGRTVRGQPHQTSVHMLYGEVEDTFDFCFPCVKTDERERKGRPY